MAKLKRTMGCGCIIGLDYDGTLAIWYCSKHESAPDLYEALKELDRWWQSTGSFSIAQIESIKGRAREALAKAEGRT